MISFWQPSGTLARSEGSSASWYSRRSSATASFVGASRIRWGHWSEMVGVTPVRPPRGPLEYRLASRGRIGQTEWRTAARPFLHPSAQRRDVDIIGLLLDRFEEVELRPVLRRDLDNQRIAAPCARRGCADAPIRGLLVGPLDVEGQGHPATAFHQATAFQLCVEQRVETAG